MSMQHKNIAVKILASISAIGMTIWFGGSIMRGIIAYDLFEPAIQLSVKNYYSPDQIYNAIYYFSAMSLYTQAAYFISVASIIAINIISRKALKKSGWLFMIIALIYLSVPVEIIRSFYDYYLSVAIFDNGITDINAGQFKDYFFDRYQKPIFTTIFSLSILANATALIFLIWKPLNLNSMEKTNEDKTNI